MSVTYEEACRKAKFGNRDWLAYTDKSGARQHVLSSPENVKRIMLAIGTAGRFTLISARNCFLHRYGWRDGVIMLRNARVGCF